jgi:hypothetical protein
MIFGGDLGRIHFVAGGPGGNGGEVTYWVVPADWSTNPKDFLVTVKPKLF